MLTDLAALTPPFLACAAVLIAVAAFLRHELRRANKSDEDEDVEVLTQDSACDTKNPADSHANTSRDREDGPSSAL